MLARICSIPVCLLLTSCEAVEELERTIELAGADEFRGVEISDENRCSAYNSSDYSYPQSVEDDIIEAQDGLFSPYTLQCYSSPRQTDIEHIVARSEAHDSGLCADSDSTRRAFARDLLNLTLAPPNLNRYEKGALDVAEWQPEHNKCWFAQRTISVRRKYGLTIDRREANAVDEVLDDCESTVMVVPACAQ